MKECFNCGKRAVRWEADFDFEDFGYDGEGVVHICHCDNCGADIEYRIETKPAKKKGRWITDAPKCSVCGQEAIIAQNDTGGAWVMTPFCPWCGAEMEREEDE